MISNGCSVQLSSAFDTHKDFKSVQFSSFERKELQVCRFKNYDITYGLFARAVS